MRALLHKIGVALAAYGPWGILLLSVLDSMGIPLPATIDVLLIGVGAASAHDPGRAYFSAFLAILGSTCGNIILFHAARGGRALFGKKTVVEPGKDAAASDRGGKFNQWFERYGLLTVFVPAVIPILPLPLKVFVISAGALRTPFTRFLVVILLARTIRYFGLALLALQLGDDAHGFLQRHGWELAGGALALTAVLVIVLRMADRRGPAVNAS